MSRFRIMLEYISIMFITYLIVNLIIYVIGDYTSYRGCLKEDYNIFLLFMLYWWIPIPRMIDIDEGK